MTLEPELKRLEQRGVGLQLAAALLIIGGLALFVVARALAPGAFGQGNRFTDIQLHMTLWSYFDGLGVQSYLQENKMVLGTQLSQIKAAFDFGRLLLGLIAFICLVRLQWRMALTLIVVIMAASCLNGFLTTKNGYKVAPWGEFGVQLRRPDAPIDCRDCDPTLPTFPGPRVDHTEEQWLEYNRQKAQSDKIRAVLASDMSGQTKPMAAALHYMGAQLAYMEDHPALVAQHLNAIRPADFNYTTDADFRIRHMREYARAHGQILSAEAYRPQTGIPLHTLRGLSKFFGLAGFVLILVGLVAAELGRKITQRLKRIRGLAERLRAVAPPSRKFAPEIATSG